MTSGGTGFLDRCRVGIEAKPSRQPNLFLRFPGLANDNPFRCPFMVAHSPPMRPIISMRVIIYKTSPFRPEEAEGFGEALAEAHVRLSDMVWISEDSNFRLYRDGAYPPLRGTYLELESNALLYCRGSVPYLRTYPGLYIPTPLLLRPYPKGESTLVDLARETLALSKMNWNSAQFDGSLPITLRASRVVGRVLKHVSLGALEAAEYRHYI